MFMKKIVLIAASGLLALNNSIEALADDNSLLCTDVDKLMYSDQQICQKGDIIMVNSMMSAFLCDLSLPVVYGDNTVVCHYLGKKRPVRESKKRN